LDDGSVKKLVRRLSNLLSRNAETLQVILRNDRTESEAIVRALVDAGPAVAVASRSVGREMDQVNRDQCFLAKVTKVVLLGSYLRADADRLSDVDIAVELQPKETDHDGLRQATEKRVEQLRMVGHRFRNLLEVEYCWHVEAFRFLKGRSRAISLIDYKADKEFVDRCLTSSYSVGLRLMTPIRDR
jgi:predicted nucleotidyltransferase